jgi:phosphate-selective porin OprO/OprP
MRARRALPVVLLAVLAVGWSSRVFGELPQTPLPARDPDPQKSNADPPAMSDPAPVAPADSDSDSQFKFNFKDGFRGETADKAFRFHAGGRFDFDSGWYQAPAHLQSTLNTPLLDGTALRRFRLGMDGTGWEQLDFKLEADFSRAADFKTFQDTPQTSVFITDAWIGLHDLPLLDTVRVGHQKDAMTFANATSSNFTPFMERPYIFDAYEDDFSFGSGISTSRTYLNERVTTWIGGFWSGTRSQAFNVGGGYVLSGRLTAMPVYDEEEQEWINLGVSASTLSIHNPPERVSIRPLVRTGQSFQVPNLIDTGTINGLDGFQVLGAALHSAFGRWTFGSEFLCRFTPNAFLGGLPNPDGTLPPGVTSAGNLFFYGYYVEALCFLTDDHRPVNRRNPGYARIVPRRTFFRKRDECGEWKRGPGAWEVGVRYDHVDVNSGPVRAGILDSVTAGVNWYLDSNAKVMFNYVFTRREIDIPNGAGNFNGLGLRFHFDF